ncbi:LamG-like jellyroll fold domain-containing protein [Planctomicrobium piriforme]|uniref:FecR protein n=1 Tax=Planctomicrobium piriforme TaxID=1576369 RepID=A0A1I3H1B0_9PLAN|nr:LamG-like jellyroll fold domain-containing protein [Planctomicrobium piriforme]SFI29471.1 FecR protein [Planctomicrobium piriforme]
MNPNYEFQDLVQRYAEGRASTAEVEQLGDRLRQSADARRQFVSLMNLDTALESIAAEWIVDHPPAGPKLPITPRRRVLIRKRYLIAIVACLVLLVSHGWNERVKHRSYAKVENGTGVPELTDGTELKDQWIEIAGGTLELLTPTAARVVIEAPATFKFESAQRLRLKRGRLAADIPPSARKFTVVTPSGEAVDLGTKFGVDVPMRSEAEIHVFQGEVIAQSSDGGKRQNLHTGEAFRLKSGGGAARELRSAAFIRPEEINSLHAALTAGQPFRSSEAIRELREDPALVALLDFESADLPDGTYDCVQGRWPGSRAAEFVKTGDHVRLDAGDGREWPQLTLAAWVRLDQDGSPYQSLFHTDRWNHKTPGHIHWMVTDQRKMRLEMHGNVPPDESDRLSTPPDSRSPVLRNQGRWIHLAAVYDADARSVRFYLNGRFDNEVRLQTAHPARLGPAQIGNWNQADRKLSGRIDEIVVLGRAMDDIEVRNLYDAGNPYR